VESRSYAAACAEVNTAAVRLALRPCFLSGLRRCVTEAASQILEPARSAAENQIVLAAEPESVPRARALLTRFLDAEGIEGDVRRNVLLVASELVTNAISHGSGPGDEIGISYTIKGEFLCISVRDAIRGSSVPVALTADDQRADGRGLTLVDRLAHWSERVVDGRREVRAEVRLQ
jgi:anti-sigma regulatory factor (Ser/Thr protein kinase)